MVNYQIPSSLMKIGVRYLLRHPLQSALLTIGIMLGVLVMVAIDIANVSASRAFDLSIDTVTGKATHVITGTGQGIDESVYVDLRLSGIPVDSAPVITDFMTSPQLGGITLQLLGVDPFVEAEFRSYLGGEGGLPVDQLTGFLTRPGAVLISDDLANQYSLSIGDDLELQSGGVSHDAFVAGLIRPQDDFSQRTLENIILADIATAQEITGRTGRIDRIDLILPDDNPDIARELADQLPSGVVLEASDMQSGTARQMTQAFQMNLTALSLLAMVVGMFLIYNSMTFSVVQRRGIFGILRSLGVTRQEVFLMVIAEAIVIGSLGAASGLVLGVLLGRGAVNAVIQTINDLYFVTTVQDVPIPVISLVKGGVIGLVATVSAAAIPAWEAASVPPREALMRSNIETKAGKVARYGVLFSIVMFSIGGLLLLHPDSGIAASFLGTFGVILGFAALTPSLMAWTLSRIIPLTVKLLGPLGRLAPRDIIASLSRTSIAVAALMVAVSVTIGISLMVSSFRYSVVTWLSQTLKGDIYVSAPGGTNNRSTSPLLPETIQYLENMTGVERVAVLRSAMVNSPNGKIHVAASDNPSIADDHLYYSLEIPRENIWDALQEGSVLVSEPLYNRLGLARHGSTIELDTPQGKKEFPVIGIYYDYASSDGTVFMARSVYSEIWDDPLITAAALWLDPGTDADDLVQDLRETLAPVQTVSVQANGELKSEVLEIFDRTFAITGVMRLLAMSVAFVGILSSLLSLQLERKRDIGIMRTIGLSVRQMWSMIMLETGLMGLFAGLQSIPTGFALALILIYIINRRSFGWTLQLEVGIAPFLTALLIAVTAAILAGIYPAWKNGKSITAESIRYE